MPFGVKPCPRTVQRRCFTIKRAFNAESRSALHYVPGRLPGEFFAPNRSGPARLLLFLTGANNAAQIDRTSGRAGDLGRRTGVILGRQLHLLGHIHPRNK